MMKIALRLTILYMLLSVSCLASAATIVDTGPGNPGGGALLFEAPGGGILAGQFSLTGTTLVNSISPFLSISNAGNLTLNIYNNATQYAQGVTYDVPGTEIYSKTIAVNISPLGPFFIPPAGWVPFSDLNLILTPGNYWVGIEMPDQSTISGIVPGYVTAPLSNYAVGDISGFSNTLELTSYPTFQISAFQFGLQIDGETSPVPLPGSFLFLLSGILALSTHFSRKQILSWLTNNK